MQTEETQQAPAARDFVASEQSLAREQIGAAWQLHIEQVREQLDKGWNEHVSKVLEERFESMRAAFDEEVEKKVSARLWEEAERHRDAGRRHLSERLNQTARRMDQAEDVAGWAAALLDGAAAFCSRAVLFSVSGGDLKYEGHRATTPQNLTALLNQRVPVTAAPAFASVAETLDTVIAMATPAELSGPLASILGGSEDKRVCLLPVISGQSERQRRVTAVLYVEGHGDPLDVNVLEVVSSMAGATLDARQAAQRSAGGFTSGVIGIAANTAPAAAQTSQAPDWSHLNREDQEIHARAQRFARVRVAEMRLYQARAVREGRESGDLYRTLRGEMERGRAQFKHEFLQTPSMIDYFHLELVRTLANDDPSLLGPEYPGPLV